MSVGTTQPIATVERAASAKTPASGASNLAAGMLWPLLSGAIGLALWEGLVRVFKVPVFILPAPSQVIVTIVDQWWYLLSQLAITTFAAGPVGALGCAFMALALRLQRPSPARLKHWYDYIAGIVARSGLTRIYDELSSGRLPSDPAAKVPRFQPILDGASIEEQQRVLGVIGRRYHADFRPALRNALRNKNGFIRAQAAAVASRLSIDEKNRLWSAGRAHQPAKDAGERPHEATDQATSGALDVEARRP